MAEGSEDSARDPSDWARLLKSSWSERARSAQRDYYVASHPGWNVPERWLEQAEIDVRTFLWGLPADRLAGWDVLEIGCGIGRLARPIAPRVKSYTGIDIAAEMIGEARERCRDVANARFLESDGLGLPAAVLDHSYDLILAVAVFIHCPREVIGSLVRAGYAALAPGGSLRFQLRADPSDPTGIVSVDLGEAAHAQMLAVEQDAGAPEMSLIESHYYMGDLFRYDEVAPWLAGLTGGVVTLVRLDRAHIYGWIERPHSDARRPQSAAERNAAD
jgi:SAM-dependent methyltransferase